MKLIFILRNIVLLLVLPTIMASAYGSIIVAHTATVNITPPLEMKYTLGGYGDRMSRPAESIHDSIYAKAIILKKDSISYAIITLDILGLPSNLKSDLVQRISSPEWKMENLMLLPSHSHGSLEMASLNSKNLINSPQIGIYQPELLEFILERLVTLMHNADCDFKPVKIGTAGKIIEGLNRNRRKDPEVDRELIITRVDHLDGEPLAALVNWTAHPTFLGPEDMMVSAEWPGYLQTELGKLIGNNVTVMFYNGAEGDQSPVFDGNINGYEKAERYGRIVAQESIELYSNIVTERNCILAFDYRVIRLPQQQAHPAFMKTGGAEYGLDENTVKVVMNMLGPKEAGLGAVRLGDLIIAGVPGEMTAALGLELKDKLRKGSIKYAAIGGLANEWISYILSRDQYLNGEGYESSVSFYGPDLGKLISDEIFKTASVLTDSK
jgi:neutral ceramidase